jgi:type IV pilus assembly protein PilX
MNEHKIHNWLKRQYCQRGIALPVVLIFVVVMTLLGVTVIRNITLEEKMAGNLNNQQIAFQAAEAALRDCENYIQNTAIAAADRFYKAQIKRDLGPGDKPPAFDNAKLSDSNYKMPGVTAKSGSNSAGASCVVELFRVPCKPMALTGTIEWCDAYRVTAQGQGATDITKVLVQSFISLP